MFDKDGTLVCNRCSYSVESGYIICGLCKLLKLHGINRSFPEAVWKSVRSLYKIKKRNNYRISKQNDRLKRLEYIADKENRRIARIQRRVKDRIENLESLKLRFKKNINKRTNDMLKSDFLLDVLRNTPLKRIMKNKELNLNYLEKFQEFNYEVYGNTSPHENIWLPIKCKCSDYFDINYIGYYISSNYLEDSCKNRNLYIKRYLKSKKETNAD